MRLAMLRGVPEKWQLKRNFAVFEQAIAKAAESNADILVTPECWLDGYASADPQSTVARLVDISQELKSSTCISNSDIPCK